MMPITRTVGSLLRRASCISCRRRARRVSHCISNARPDAVGTKSRSRRTRETSQGKALPPFGSQRIANGPRTQIGRVAHASSHRNLAGRQGVARIDDHPLRTRADLRAPETKWPALWARLTEAFTTVVICSAPLRFPHLRPPAARCIWQDHCVDMPAVVFRHIDLAFWLPWKLPQKH